MTDEQAAAASDNVFADLGFENPEEEMLKAKLVREIRAVIKSRRLTQTKAAALIGVKQPDVSSILAGRTGKYSIDRLLRCLHRLDCEVEISVRRRTDRSPRPAAAA
jgi:predicted XRE-type DNA-binding protein